MSGVEGGGGHGARLPTDCSLQQRQTDQNTGPPHSTSGELAISGFPFVETRGPGGPGLLSESIQSPLLCLYPASHNQACVGECCHSTLTLMRGCLRRSSTTLPPIAAVIIRHDCPLPPDVIFLYLDHARRRQRLNFS